MARPHAHRSQRRSESRQTRRRHRARMARAVRLLNRAAVGGGIAVVLAARRAEADAVSVTPSSGGLPGTATLVNLLDGLQFDAILAAIAGVIVSAAAWALSAHSNNFAGAGRAKTALLASGLAALLIGFGPALVQTLFATGAAAR